MITISNTSSSNSIYNKDNKSKPYVNVVSALPLEQVEDEKEEKDDHCYESNQTNISIISKGELYIENKLCSEAKLYTNKPNDPTEEVSDINPLDFINPLITNTNGSNIFSELQEQEQEVLPDLIPSTPEKYNIESLENMSYSKSKSIIISELPMQYTSTKKKNDRSEHSITNFTVKKLKGEDKDNNSIYSIEDSNCNVNKKRIRRHMNRSKESSMYLNVIDLAKKFNDEDNDKEEERWVDISNTNTQDLSRNTNTVLNSNYNNNTANSNSNKTASAIYSVNSTRIQTQLNNKQLIPSNRNQNHIRIEDDNINDNDQDEEIANPHLNDYDTNQTQILNYSFPNKPQSRPYHSRQLHQWLCSIDLLCYYTKILNSDLIDLNQFSSSNSTLKSHSHLTYNQIEHIGIKKPGHIFRILLKLQCDSLHINQSVLHFLLPNKMIGDARLSQSHSDLLLIKDTCCGCLVKENRMTKQLDLDDWLRFKGLSHLREHFIHNGFESIEYVLLQMFSNEYQLTDESLLNYFHMYDAKDRKKVLKELVLQKQKICGILGIKFNDLEYEDYESNCRACVVF